MLAFVVFSCKFAGDMWTSKWICFSFQAGFLVFSSRFSIKHKMLLKFEKKKKKEKSKRLAVILLVNMVSIYFEAV